MSILPPNANQGSSSSSSSCAPSNPKNYGLLSQQPRQAGESQLSPSTDLPDLESLGISGLEPSSISNVNVVSDSVEQAASVQNIGAATKKVRGYGRSYGNNRSSDQETHPRVEHSVASRKESFTQYRAEASGTSASPPSQRGNGSGTRRSQMMNGNHLLNFHYDPISRRQPTRALPPPRKPGKFKPYNKDLFLQANYKFVVLDTGHYDLDSMDPDKMLQWEDIICLKYSTPYPVNCPICLESPLCPQITSCGHVFCFPCILRYLLMGEDNLKRECWKKCPLCFVMISSRELYTIDVENVKLYRTGDELEFVLLTREKNSFALLQNFHEGADPRSFDLFSKFILTSDVNLSVRNAMSDLDGWLAKADAGLVDDMEKLPYVCAAMDQLEKRKNYWNERRRSQGGKAADLVNGKMVEEGSGNGNSSSDSSTPARQFGRATPDVAEPGSFVYKTCDSLESSPSSDHEGNLVALSQVSLGTNDKDSYYFYQAVDGQHIILHPLNMKCLLHHYGSNEKLPTRLSGRILELETVTQSEAIRKRYRFLSHFPLTATFQFCEVDLSNIIPVESLSPFADLIKKRGKQREQLARKEHKEKVKAEAVAAYYAPSSNYGASYINDEPTFSMDDFEALGSPIAPVLSPPATGQRSLFASVARLGFAAGYDSPSLNSETQSGRNTEGSGSGSSVPSGSTATNRGAASFSSIISREPPVENRPQPKAGEMGKKGKKPSRVLLSTSGGRRY